MQSYRPGSQSSWIASRRKIGRLESHFRLAWLGNWFVSFCGSCTVRPHRGPSSGQVGSRFSWCRRAGRDCYSFGCPGAIQMRTSKRWRSWFSKPFRKVQRLGLIGTNLGDGDVGAEAVHRLEVAVFQPPLGPDGLTFLLETRFVLSEKRMEIKRKVFRVQVSRLEIWTRTGLWKRRYNFRSYHFGRRSIRYTNTNINYGHNWWHQWANKTVKTQFRNFEFLLRFEICFSSLDSLDPKLVLIYRPLNSCAIQKF